MRVLEGPGNESRGYPTWILVRSQRDPEKKSQGESGQIQDGSQINPGRIPARSQIKTRQIPNISCMDPAQSQFNYRQIPVRLQRDSKKLFQGLRADPRKIPKRKSQLDPPEKTPKGFRTDRKKILGFVWENSSVLRLFPAFPTAFPGRRQSQELHHLLQRYLAN